MAAGSFTAVLNFGAFPGVTDTSVAVTGQTALGATDKVDVWVRLEATAEHNEDEHLLLRQLVSVGVKRSTIVAGTGFTVYGVVTGKNRMYGQVNVEGAYG